MMLLTKEAKLVWAVLEFAGACLAEGDFQGLESIGFTREDVEKLEALQLSDCRHFNAFRGHTLSVQVDRTRFHRLLRYIEKSRAEEAARDYLLANDAPCALLRGLYGLDSKTCVAHRARYGVRARLGRTREATPEEGTRSWTAYQALGKPSVERMSAFTWMEIHQRTGTPLRVLWQLINDWSTQAGHPGTRDGAGSVPPEKQGQK